MRGKDTFESWWLGEGLPQSGSTARISWQSGSKLREAFAWTPQKIVREALTVLCGGPGVRQ